MLEWLVRLMNISFEMGVVCMDYHGEYITALYCTYGMVTRMIFNRVMEIKVLEINLDFQYRIKNFRDTIRGRTVGLGRIYFTVHCVSSGYTSISAGKSPVADRR